MAWGSSGSPSGWKAEAQRSEGPQDSDASFLGLPTATAPSRPLWPRPAQAFLGGSRWVAGDPWG